MADLRKKVGLLFTALGLSHGLSATVRLPALVGDNMVLQRDAKLNLWGWAAPGEPVSVQFRDKTVRTTTPATGKWALVLPPVAAGGPDDLVVKGSNTLTIRNVLVGDVWLAAGQSNMAWPLNTVTNAAQEVQTADFPQIRLFQVETDVAFKPRQELLYGKWAVCSPHTVHDFSAVAYLFGRELHQRYKVPIGLISSSVGATPAQAWISAAALKPFPNFTNKVTAFAQADLSAFEAYQTQRDAWFRQAGYLDQGHLAGHQSWADPNLNTADWGKLKLPGFWSSVKELKGYARTVWVRKNIDVPAVAAGQPLTLNLGALIVADSVFFNGQLVGTSGTYDTKRVYQVPGRLVKAGLNVITGRIVGALDVGGVVSIPNQLCAQTGDTKIPLAGEWLYKPGADLSQLPAEVKADKLNPDGPRAPTVLFNAMLAPLIPYTMKGAIWYQGEANADSLKDARQYNDLFPALIQDWRQRWGYDFPFLFVQLAGYQANSPEPDDYGWAHLREAQAHALALPRTGMATAIDVGDEKNIHPRNKQAVAHRLALAAEKVAYGENVVHSGPTLQRMRVEGSKIRLTFANVGTGLVLRAGSSQGFAIAGADKKFVWATAVQAGNDILVSAAGVPQPVAVRYNWLNTPNGQLYNKESLPAVPFRTDAW